MDDGVRPVEPGIASLGAENIPLRRCHFTVFHRWNRFVFPVDFMEPLSFTGICRSLAENYCHRLHPVPVLLLYNHYQAFSYFASNYHPISEVLGYFILCLWIVPCAFLVSLSANDAVLPTTTERTLLAGKFTLKNLVANFRRDRFTCP